MGSNFEDAFLAGCKIVKGDLSYVNLRRQDLRSQELHEVKLVGADLSGCNLEKADLSGADLSQASLERARRRGLICGEPSLPG
ncbi:MAG: pentapeptide repeat-containing protein [Firmicutes bacterium]|nr:pentapeptide repeat-containing protein [Bacillota bacterium]